MGSGGSNRYKIDDTGAGDSGPGNVGQSSHSQGAAVLVLGMRNKRSGKSDSLTPRMRAWQIFPGRGSGMEDRSLSRYGAASSFRGRVTTA